MSKAVNTVDREEVSVQIGGRRYRLCGPDPEQLERLAGRVDEALTEIAGGPEGRDDFKVAVLAALNLAGDHDELRLETIETTVALRERAKSLAQRLERLQERIAD